MLKNILMFLCCPNCRSDLSINNVSHETPEEIFEGYLFCSNCRISYQIINGIPVLLPFKYPNYPESNFRDKISKAASYDIDKWISQCDNHHFRELTYLRIKDQLSNIPASIKPNVLDVGIGWALNYLPFITRINLIGLDFSLESLLLAKTIYERKTKIIPNLICASLSAIPIKNINFDLIWSNQVYQHVPNIEDIKLSFNYIVRKLLNRKRKFIVNNLSFYNFYFSQALKQILRKKKVKDLRQEDYTEDFYIKYYLVKDFELLVKDYDNEIKYKILFTENLFHPEIRLMPRCYFVASLDLLIQKAPFAKFIGRQISLVIEKQ